VDTTQKIIQDGSLRQAQLKMLAMLQFVDSTCQAHGLDYWLEGGSLLGAIRHQGFIPWDDDLDIAMPRASFNRFMEVAPQALPETMFLQTPKTDQGYYNLAVQLKIRDRDSRYIEKKERGDEPYQQGIYVDIFVYDKRSANKINKLAAKKICRILHHKYAAMYLQMGHYRRFYKTLAYFIPKFVLEHFMQRIIDKANASESPWLGYGYDCLNSSYFNYDDFYPLQKTLFEGSHFNIPHRPEVMLKAQFGDFWTLPPEEKRFLKHCRELSVDVLYP
jgi:lipopolysaccharide cholinephosphotransferase